MDSIVRTLKARRTPLNVKEVSELLRFSPWTVYKMVEEGAIPFAKIGGALRFDPESLTTWLESKSFSPVLKEGRRS